MSKIDQVRTVGQTTLRSVDAMVFAPLNKQIGMFWIHSSRLPFTLVLHEQCEGVSPVNVSNNSTML